MQTHLVPKIMHQNLAVILWQFNYGKSSFMVLIPGHTVSLHWRVLRYKGYKLFLFLRSVVPHFIFGFQIRM